MLLNGIIYGGSVVWLCLGGFLGLRGRVGLFFLITIALLLGLFLVALFNSDAQGVEDMTAIAFSFGAAIFWLPALWAGFWVSALAVWIVGAVRSQGARKRK
jgi:hypothetical protein